MILLLTIVLTLTAAVMRRQQRASQAVGPSAEPPAAPPEPPQAGQPQLPAEPPQPAEPQQPAEPPQPAEPQQPAEPPQPAEPQLPAQPPEPAVAPSRPTVRTPASQPRRSRPAVARQAILPAVTKGLLASSAALSRRRQATNGRAASSPSEPRPAPPGRSPATQSSMAPTPAARPPEPPARPVVATDYPQALVEPRPPAPVPQSTEPAPTSPPPRSSPAQSSFATAQAEICEIRWARVNGRSEFQAVRLQPADGSRALVARSPEFRWRLPVSPDATPASTSAHAALVRQLLATGWQPLGRSGALHWYEDRFRAQPTKSTVRRAAATPRAVCEIKWVKVKGRSEFQAVASGPEGTEVLIGRSPSFRWRLPVSPDATPAAAAAHETLVSQLLAAGWQALERGGLVHWYGERFRSPDPPPDDHRRAAGA